MSKWMTIKDALEEFDLFDLFTEVVESCSEEVEDKTVIDSELYDLVEEHDEEYEFSTDSDGDWAESFERNLREALAVILESQGLTPQEDFSEEAMDDIDIEDIYETRLDEKTKKDPRGYGADADEYDQYEQDDELY